MIEHLLQSVIHRQIGVYNAVILSNALALVGRVLEVCLLYEGWQIWRWVRLLAKQAEGR